MNYLRLLEKFCFVFPRAFKATNASDPSTKAWIYLDELLSVTLLSVTMESLFIKPSSKDMNNFTWFILENVFMKKNVFKVDVFPFLISSPLHSLMTSHFSADCSYTYIYCMLIPDAPIITTQNTTQLYSFCSLVLFIKS